MKRHVRGAVGALLRSRGDKSESIAGLGLTATLES
jgi:hypothetical protein